MGNMGKGASGGMLSASEVRELVDGASRVLIAFGTSMLLFPITSRALTALCYLILNAIA